MSGPKPGGSNRGPWHEYLARCQYLLQQGLWVADVCHISVERAPNELYVGVGPGLLGERPGYNYDAAPCGGPVRVSRCETENRVA